MKGLGGGGGTGGMHCDLHLTLSYKLHKNLRPQKTNSSRQEQNRDYCLVFFFWGGGGS